MSRIATATAFAMRDAMGATVGDDASARRLTAAPRASRRRDEVSTRARRIETTRGAITK